MYDEEKEQLRRCKDYLVKSLRPSCIRIFMNEYLGREDVEQILSVEERQSVTMATALLLDRVCELDSPGWYQSFLDILLETGYKGLHEALQQWDFSALELSRKHRVLLEKIETSFTHNVNPAQLLPHLQDVLSERQRQEILKRQETCGPIQAATLLSDCLRRSDCSSWFKQLKVALGECEFYAVLRLLATDDELCKPIKGEEGDMEEATTVSLHYEEAEEEGLMESANQPSAQDGGDGPAPHSSSQGQKHLRRYQEELAGPVNMGHNTIICAPTGCGKTVVALQITEDHLATRGEGSKVVFMATKVEVYEQQLGVFTQHFKEKDPDIRIQGMCGNLEGQLSLSVVVETNDVIVLTPQILVNALQAGDLPSLGCFSMLIFDECHNTTGKHPYNIIMMKYLDSKLGDSAQPLPQIVGLTASVGIGSFKNQKEAEENVCQLCANLDTQVISTVQQNVEELHSFVYSPEKEFFPVEPRSGDAFIQYISAIMSKIEDLARTTLNIDALFSLHSGAHGSQGYEQWIVNVQRQCLVLQLNDTHSEQSVCRAVYNYTEHLRKYNDALIIHNDARTRDALDFLSSFMQQFSSSTDPTEMHLLQCFMAHEQKLKALATGGQCENPKLETLQYILQEKYREDPQTRTVLFVRTRALADALKAWMEETESLRHLKPGVLIGRGRRTHLTTSGHMTLKSQKGVLDEFKSSHNQSKVLIATSVADEGIDIPQCNLVLMYEYVGNVVKMVQVRGRGRARGSVCILVSDRKERIQKEKSNMAKERLVEEAIRHLQENAGAMGRRVCVLQQLDHTRRQHEQSVPERRREEGRVSLLCKKCKEPVCTSEDIRVLQDAHHIVVNPSIFSHATTKPSPKPISFGGITKTRKLYCGNCSLDWGIVATFQHIPDLPVLKIDSFVVEDWRSEVRVLRHFRKWKEVFFSMQDFSVQDVPASWAPLPLCE